MKKEDVFLIKIFLAFKVNMENSFRDFINFRIYLQIVNICGLFQHLFLTFSNENFLNNFLYKKISQANA